jgi:hypothetical protein
MAAKACFRNLAVNVSPALANIQFYEKIETSF